MAAIGSEDMPAKCNSSRAIHANKKKPATRLFPLLNTLGHSVLRRASHSHPMEEVQAAVTAHLDQLSGLVEALSSELRRGIGPAADSLLAFVHAVDWTEPWLMCLMAFHAILLLAAVGLRRNGNLQLFLLFLAYSGVYLAEKINSYLGEHWKSFASRNYFDRAGVFVSVVWSGPLIFVSIVTVVSSLMTLCRLMVKWKRAELRHRARLARDKQD